MARTIYAILERRLWRESIQAKAPLNSANVIFHGITCPTGLRIHNLFQGFRTSFRRCVFIKHFRAYSGHLFCSADGLKLMKPEGLFILAVPPITDDCSKQVNVTNPYHLHIWSSRQWRHVLSMFFQDIQPYSHLFVRAHPALDLFCGSGKH